MVQILEEIPSFSTQFARSFGKGVSGGLEKGLSIAQQLAGKREKLEAQQQAKREKLAGAASRDFAAFTKQYHPTLFENKDLLNKANGLYQEIISSNPSFSEKDKEKAFALAVKGAQQLSSEMPQEENAGDFFNQKRNGGLVGDLYRFFMTAAQALKKRPSLALTELPSAAGKFEESLDFNPTNKFLSSIGKKVAGTETGTQATPERM